jgi:Family of unknown function (DUF6252)
LKKLHFCTLIIGLLFLSPGCKKNNDTENYLRGKTDGQSFESNAGITANKPEPIPGAGDDPTLRLTGDWPSYSLKLMLIGEGKIRTGTYTFESSKERSATLSFNTNDAYYAGSQGFFLGGGPLMGSGSITITEVSKKYVKGNFEFTAVDLPQGNTKTVTNGEFSINRK